MSMNLKSLSILGRVMVTKARIEPLLREYSSLYCELGKMNEYSSLFVTEKLIDHLFSSQQT